jgi:hypothetical protein
MSPRGRRPTTSKSRPKRGGEQAQKQPNQPNSAQHHHGPTLQDQRRHHDESGLKVAHLGCGRTHGAGTPLVGPLGPNLLQVIHTASLWSVQMVLAVHSMQISGLVPSMRG